MPTSRRYNSPAFRRSRPAPRLAPGTPPRLNDDITWTRECHPREKYRIIYRDRDNAMTERVVELVRIGELKGSTWYGVMHLGKFKTLRADRVVSLLEQLTEGHSPSIDAQPTYATRLPAFPLADARYKVATIAAGTRTWTVDLNAYTCTCPERRIRLAHGYEPGMLGFCCPHMARAILDHLPADAGWGHALKAFLGDPRKLHIDSLT